MTREVANTEMAEVDEAAAEAAAAALGDGTGGEVALNAEDEGVSPSKSRRKRKRDDEEDLGQFYDHDVLMEDMEPEIARRVRLCFFVFFP